MCIRDRIEGELNKEWDFLSEEYIGLLARTGRGMKYSLSFPVESHVSVTSPRTGIVWNIMIMLEDPKVIHYAFYTFYTNEYGEKGIYLIDEYRCSRVTPHYMKRLNSRYRCVSETAYAYLIYRLMIFTII